MTLDQSLRALQAGLRFHDWLLLLRFGLVGVLNAAFAYAVFALLLHLDIWPGAALVAAAAVGTAFNFQTSRRLVFRSRGRVVRFIVVYALVLAFNWAALRALRWCSLPDLESQALLTLPIAAISFFGQRRFVFGRTA